MLLKVLIPFSDPASGKRAVRQLLSDRPSSPFEVELLAVVEPLTPGKVRIFLSPERAEALVRAAAVRWLSELEELLAASQVRYRSQVMVGQRTQIVSTAIRRGDVDQVLLPANGPRWLNRLLAKGRGKRLSRATGRLIAVVP